MAYPAEIARSEKQKHPLLIYRSTIDNALCFKFRWKYEGSEFHSYKCLGCSEAAKVTFGATVASLRVSEDYTTFLSNPEAMTHICQAPGFTYRYVDSVVQQAYR
jgi:hypothetical protein